MDRPQTWEAIPGVNRVFDPQVDPEGALRGFAFESAAGGRTYLGKATLAERFETRLMSWDLATSEINGVLSVGLFDAQPGTRVEVSLTVESLGVLSSMFFPMIAGAIGSGFPQAVDRFAASLH